MASVGCRFRLFDYFGYFKYLSVAVIFTKLKLFFCEREIALSLVFFENSLKTTILLFIAITDNLYSKICYDRPTNL